MTCLWMLCALTAQLASATTELALAPPLADSLIAALQRGGYVVVFRHTHTDRSRMESENWSIADRSTQRNLSDRGAEEARRIGRAFIALGIPVGEVLSSPMFRARETAEHAFGRADTTEMLRTRGSTDEARALLTVPPAPSTNRILVTHNAYIDRHFSAAGHGRIGEGDAVVVRPLGSGEFEVLGRIRVDEWQRLVGATGDASPARPAGSAPARMDRIPF